MCAQRHGRLPSCRRGHVQFRAAAEGDHTEALAAGEAFADREGGDDAAGDGADDLFDDGGGWASQSVREAEGVALVFGGAVGVGFDSGTAPLLASE